MQKKEQEVYFALQGKHSLDNTFVIKKSFFRNEYQKNFLTRTFFVDSAEWRQANIFLSLALSTRPPKMYTVIADGQFLLHLLPSTYYCH